MTRSKEGAGQGFGGLDQGGEFSVMGKVYSLVLPPSPLGLLESSS